MQLVPLVSNKASLNSASTITTLVTGQMSAGRTLPTTLAATTLGKTARHQKSSVHSASVGLT